MKRARQRPMRQATIRSFFALVSVLVAATSPAGQTPLTAEARGRAPGRSPARAREDVAGLLRYEPTGLSLLRPYERGKVPVVFVHGLWSNPCSWSPMIDSPGGRSGAPRSLSVLDLWLLDRRPAAVFGVLLRSNLDQVRRKFDPESSDRAFDKMVVVGHSMGGLLTKMMVQETGRPFVADRQRSAGGRTGGRSSGSRPVPPRTDLQAAAGSPPRGIHRHAPSRQPGRSRAAGTPRLAAHSPARPAAGDATTGSSLVTSRTSSTNGSAKDSRPASTNWSGDRPS